MFSNYPGIKLEPVLQMWGDKIKDLLSYAHVVHTTAKKVISHHGKNKNAFEMCKNEKMHLQKHCSSLSNMQICDVLVTFIIVII